MKKRFIAILLCVTLVTLAAIGASFAYLTSSDSATNTFTVGNVKIDLIEQERKLDADGNKTTELKAFDNGHKLYPIIGSAQGEKDTLGMPTAKNYVDKMVTIRNTGSEAAYIRAYFAIPAALDDGYETFNAGMNVLHFNFGNKVVNGVISSTEGVEWQWTHGSKWNYFKTTLSDGIKYNVYYADYYKALDPQAETEQLIQGVYLDKTFNMTENGPEAFGKPFEVDAGWNWNNVSCPVYAVACQAEGFDSAAAAMDAAFGANYNPWGGAASNWQ